MYHENRNKFEPRYHHIHKFHSNPGVKNNLRGVKHNRIAILKKLNENSDKKLAQENRNFFNFSVYLLCSCLCVWQVEISVERYFTQPVVNIVQPQYINEFIRPSITICHSEFPIADIMKFIQHYCDKGQFKCPNKDAMNFKLSSNEWDIDYLWGLFGITAANVKIDYRTAGCSYAVNVSECNNGASNVIFSHVRSPTGYCSKFNETLQYYFFVSKTGNTKIDIKGDAASYVSKLLIMLNLEGNDILPRHLNHAIRIPFPGKSFISILSVTEIKRLNYKNNRCSEDNYDARKKEVMCVTFYLTNLLPCSLPFFIRQNLSDCDKMRDVNLALAETKKIINEINEVCTRVVPCTEIVYKIQNQHVNIGKHLSIDLRILSNVKFVVEEKFIYKPVDMSTDIAGNIGFFLGLSLFGILKDGSHLIFKRKNTDDVKSIKKTRTQCVYIAKILNILVFVFCIALCAWQVAICTYNFFSYPTLNTVSLVRKSSFKYPGITFCSSNLLFRNYLMQLVKKFLVRSPLVKGQTNADILQKLFYYSRFDQMNLTIRKIGNIIGLDQTKILTFIADCKYAEDPNLCEQVALEGVDHNRLIYVVPGGSCATNVIDINYRITSAIFLKFKILKNIQLLSNNWTQFSLLIHNPRIEFRHSFYITANSREFITHYENRVFDFDIVVTWVTKTIMLNTTKNPCYTEAEAEKEYDSCMDKQLERVIPCGLPYVNSTKLEECSTLADYKIAHQVSFEFIGQKAHQFCPKPRTCELTTYRFIINSIPGKESDNLSVIKLKFLENIIETIEEKWAYLPSNFFADLSNYLGFFLDLSLIGLFILVINTVKKLLNGIRS